METSLNPNNQEPQEDNHQQPTELEFRKSPLPSKLPQAHPSQEDPVSMKVAHLSQVPAFKVLTPHPHIKDPKLKVLPTRLQDTKQEILASINPELHQAIKLVQLLAQEYIRLVQVQAQVFIKLVQDLVQECIRPDLHLELTNPAATNLIKETTVTRAAQ